MGRSSRPRRAAELSESLHQQLTMYALAASAAGVSMLALAQPAEARIKYTPAHVIFNGGSYGLDLNHDGIVDFQLYLSASADFVWMTVFPYKGNSVWGTGRYASALPAGVGIGPPRNGGKRPPGGWLMFREVMHTSNEYFGQWVNVKNRYLGLSFTIHGKVHYGWARLNALLKGKPYRALLTGYAYETIPNKPIITGKTKGPDVTTVRPASLGHLAAGASAIPAWRVKRTAATTH